MSKINIKILGEKLSLDAAYASVLDDSCGGNCLFIGTVRNRNKGKSVTHLDFETYEAMAVKEMHKIAESCIEKYDVKKVSIWHRSGEVAIRDIAVIIAISSVHRKSSFEACEYAIDQLKLHVPIWKKEYLEDGSYWVGARP